MHADKGDDTDRVRQIIENQEAAPNIPPRANRRWKNCFSPFLYRDRNAIERMFGRLKDFRRIATRHDRLAVNFLAAVQIAAFISYWLSLGFRPALDVSSALRAWEQGRLLTFVHSVSSGPAGG